MKAWNYSRTYTMSISYTVIMLRSAGAKFPPEYSDINLIVKIRCVKQMWVSGNWRASLVVSVSSETRLARRIQSSLRHPLQRGTVVAVCLYVLLLLYFSYLCHWSSFHRIRLIISHFPLTLNSLRMSVLNNSYDSFIGIVGFRTVKF